MNEEIFCANCGYIIDKHDNFINIVSPNLRIRNNDEVLVWENEGVYHFCGLSCLNTYLMRIASDDDV